MMNATLTLPLSYTQSFSTFWAANYTATGTGLSGKRFVDFPVYDPIRNRLVGQHLTEGRPTRIKNGLSHSSFNEFGTVNVANENNPVLTNDICRNLMEKVAPLSGDLGGYILGLPLLSRPLRLGKPRLRIPVILGAGDFVSIRQTCEVFKAKINSNGFFAVAHTFWQFYNYIQIPSASGILRETRPITEACVFRYRPRFPDRKFLAVIFKSVFGCPYIGRSKWNPAEGLLSSKSKPWAFKLLAGFIVLRTYAVNGVGGYFKFYATARSKLHKLIMGWPFLTPLQCAFLRIVAKIPNKIYRPCMAIKQIFMLIFDAVFVGNYHLNTIAK